MGCPSFYHEIGDCDVCMQMREREKKTKQIQKFDDKKKLKKNKKREDWKKFSS